MMSVASYLRAAAPQLGRARHGREPHRAYADDHDVVAELHVGKLHAVEARGHHVGKHGGFGYVHAFRPQRKIAVRIVDMEIFAEYAFLEVGEFPSGQHAAGVHGVAALEIGRVPVGSDGGDHDLVARLEVSHQRAGFHDFADGFMSEMHVVTGSDGLFPDGMDVRGARGHDGVKRTAGRPCLFNPDYTAW